jgi:hypothetical protein
MGVIHNLPAAKQCSIKMTATKRAQSHEFKSGGLVDLALCASAENRE